MQLLTTKIFHRRFIEPYHKLNYKIFNVKISLSDIKKNNFLYFFSYNKFNLFSFYEKDYGIKNENISLETWFFDTISQYLPENESVSDISIIAIPRILGYAFNPISIWIVKNLEAKIICILYEVSNTFGEKHIYVAPVNNNDNHIIRHKVEKVFHVSPFMKREGGYLFRFKMTDNMLHLTIRYEIDGEKQLVAIMDADFENAMNKNLFKKFVQYPFMIFKVIGGIFFHAFIMKLKGAKYRNKPEQRSPNITLCQEINF